MLSSPHRMRRSADFGMAVRAGRRAGRPRLVVHLAAGAQGDPPRVGLVASRAVGTAVTRNRLKRQLRALLRVRLDTLPPGALLVVRCNPAAAGASSGELAHDLDKALARVAGRSEPRSAETGSSTDCRPGSGTARSDPVEGGG